MTRENKNFVVWFTGLSGSGKSTLGEKLKEELETYCTNSFILDGDVLRTGLCSDLGFSDKSRVENIRRVGEVTKLLFLANQNLICSFISPFKKERDNVSKLIGKNNFIEIYLDCSVAVCEKRDVKGLYKKARLGEIKNFTGIDSDYQVPKKPSLVLDTCNCDARTCVAVIIDYLKDKKFI